MQRVRTSGGFGALPLGGISWTAPGSPRPPMVTSNVADVVGTVVTMKDVVTPGYKKLQNRGVIVNNAMSRVTETRTPGLGTVTFAAPKGIPLGSQVANLEYLNITLNDKLSLSNLPAGIVPDFQRMLAEVRTRALANVARPDFQGLVSLGELRESLTYLRNPLKGAVKLANALEYRIADLYRKEKKRARFSFYPVKDPRKGKLNPEDARIVAELESIYLEFRYGVRPMIQEITSALENVRERAVPRPKRQTFRASGQQSDFAAWTVIDAGVFPFADFQVDHSYVYERKVSASTGLLYEFTSDYGIGDKWGLELGQLPQTLWQLATLSFVVDWGLNVGQFISALTPAPGVRRLSAWTTVRVEHKLKRSYSNWFTTWSVMSPGQTTTGGISPDTLEVKTYDRDIVVPLPDLVFKQNALETFSELPKVIDLAAIFHQKVTNALGMGKEISQTITRRVGRPHAAVKWYG
jgi:hypothetical protein